MVNLQGASAASDSSVLWAASAASSFAALPGAPGRTVGLQAVVKENQWVP